jgi:flagellar assembly factor FliW
MVISTVRFGELSVPDDKIIVMAKPVLGFEHLKRYCLIEREEAVPFLWYQSVDDPEVAFIVVNPLVFRPDYHIDVNPKEIEELEVTDVRAVETYVIVTVPANPAEISINLQGPILINTETRIAKQLVLVNSDYDVKHFLIADEEADSSEILVPEAVESAMTV